MSDEGKPSTREEQARRLAESMKRQLGQFCGFLAEPGLVELMLNADGTVWGDRLGQGMAPVGTMPSASAESFIGTVASILRSTVTREKPILECELPLEAPFEGSRFEALVPPVVSAPVFTIRRKASALFTLQEYERQGILACRQRTAIESAVAQRHNILVVGGTDHATWCRPPYVIAKPELPGEGRLGADAPRRARLRARPVDQGRHVQ